MRPKQIIPLIIAVLAVTGALSSEAKAGGAVFGTHENIHRIKELESAEFHLCHKTSLHFFIAGIYVSDDGYVLQKTQESKSYIPLDSAKISQLQAEGMLPNPLPSYSIPLSEYLIGYSLWIFFGLVIGLPIVWGMIRRAAGGDRAPTLLSDARYQEALRIALNTPEGGLNNAVDYLQKQGVPLEKAQTDMQFLLAQGTTVKA